MLCARDRPSGKTARWRAPRETAAHWPGDAGYRAASRVQLRTPRKRGQTRARPMTCARRTRSLFRLQLHQRGIIHLVSTLRRSSVDSAVTALRLARLVVTARYKVSGPRALANHSSSSEAPMILKPILTTNAHEAFLSRVLMRLVREIATSQARPWRSELP